MYLCMYVHSLYGAVLGLMQHESTGQLAAAFGANADVIILIIRHVVRTSCTNEAESTLQAHARDQLQASGTRLRLRN